MRSLGEPRPNCIRDVKRWQNKGVGIYCEDASGVALYGVAAPKCPPIVNCTLPPDNFLSANPPSQGLPNETRAELLETEMQLPTHGVCISVLD